jgi:hypothetical protein
VELFTAHVSRTPPEGLWNGVFNRITAPEPAREPLLRWPPLLGWPTLRTWPGRGLAMAAVAAVVAAVMAFPRPEAGPSATEPVGWAQPDPEAVALIRQRALTQAESPFGSRALWEFETVPVRASEPGAGL